MTTAAWVRMWKMRHMCHLLGHDKGLASSSGSGAMRDEEMKKMMVMRVKRMKKYLMLKRSTLHHMLTLDILISGLLRTLHGG
jgi:hypothetical protein